MGVTPWVTMTRRRNGRVSVRLGRLPRGYRLVETVEHRRGDEEVGAEGFGHHSSGSRDVCGHPVGDPSGCDEPGRHHDPAGAWVQSHVHWCPCTAQQGATAQRDLG